MTREELINQIKQKISLVIQLYNSLPQKQSTLNSLKAELENIRRAKFPWFTGTVDDIISNWVAIKSKILQMREEELQRRAEYLKQMVEKLNLDYIESLDFSKLSDTELNILNQTLDNVIANFKQQISSLDSKIAQYKAVIDEAKLL